MKWLIFVNKASSAWHNIKVACLWKKGPLHGISVEAIFSYSHLFPQENGNCFSFLVCVTSGPCLNIKRSFWVCEFSLHRLSLNRLIFVMLIFIQVAWHHYINTGPSCYHFKYSIDHKCLNIKARRCLHSWPYIFCISTPNWNGRNEVLPSTNLRQVIFNATGCCYW